MISKPPAVSAQHLSLRIPLFQLLLTSRLNRTDFRSKGSLCLTPPVSWISSELAVSWLTFDPRQVIGTRGLPVCQRTR